MERRQVCRLGQVTQIPTASLPPRETVAGRVDYRNPNALVRIFEKPPDLASAQNAVFAIVSKGSRGLELREVVDGRKMEDAVCYPPFAVARLQCHAFVNPTRVLAFRGIEREPSDPLSVEAAEADKKVGLAQRVNPPALKDAGALIRQNESPEAHAAGAIA